MTSVNPNEIIDEWNNVPELVVVLSDAPRRDGQPNRIKQIVADAQDLVDVDSETQATNFAFEFLDGDGEPIKFPVTLVSETKFERT